MTKKDYELIARVIARNISVANDRDQNQDVVFGLCHLATDLSRELAQTNPRFNRIKFLKACGTPT